MEVVHEASWCVSAVQALLKASTPPIILCDSCCGQSELVSFSSSGLITSASSSVASLAFTQSFCIFTRQRKRLHQVSRERNAITERDESECESEESGTKSCCRVVALTTKTGGWGCEVSNYPCISSDEGEYCVLCLTLVLFWQY